MKIYATQARHFLYLVFFSLRLPPQHMLIFYFYGIVKYVFLSQIICKQLATIYFRLFTYRQKNISYFCIETAVSETAVSETAVLYTHSFNQVFDVFKHSRSLPFFGGSNFFCNLRITRLKKSGKKNRQDGLGECIKQPILRETGT